MVKTRLFHSIVEQITVLIKEGVFPPGTRLPSERELAERFNVNRVAIREAEIALQAIGLLAIKSGSGVYVSEKHPDDYANIPDVNAFELTEARLLVESEAAALAAMNISDEDLDNLRSLIDQMASLVDAVSTAADEQFHLSIAKATGNAVIVHTIKGFWRMREELPQVKAIYDSVCETDTAYRVKEHRDICDALQARDPAAARRAMREHFKRLIEAMLDATEKQALAEVQQRASESRLRFLASTQAA